MTPMDFHPDALSSFGNAEPEIEYPCRWQYRLMGAAEAALRGAVERVVGAREHQVQVGNQSRTGKYCSLEVEIEVASRNEQHDLFQRLRAEPGVIYVL